MSSDGPASSGSGCLTLEQVRVLIDGPCHYCGTRLANKRICSNRPGRTMREYRYNGIDRLNNSCGYTIENCVSCCGSCNVAKLDKTVEDFQLWLDQVTTHNVLKFHRNLHICYNETFKYRLWNGVCRICGCRLAKQPDGFIRHFY